MSRTVLTGEGSVSTTDDTLTTIVTVAVSAPSVSMVRARVVARASNGNTAAWYLGALVSRSTDEPALTIGDVVEMFHKSNAGNDRWSATILSSSDSFFVVVRGTESDSIEWSATVDAFEQF